ncbi:MAG: tetratricopeptide repeat protein [Aquimonas sp.]|nr:tetratricopeptide repeat protein [Aquimonas sp.]
MLGTEHRLYRFADFRLDLARLELSRGERVLNVEAKVLQLLACLVERPGEVWTKDELLERVWPGRIVTEGTLAKAVMKLRAALADDAQELVRTVHGFGYRFGVEVETGEAPMPAALIYEPCAGDAVPQRPNWRLLHALDADARGLVWLAEHSKTRDRRVFKFARDGESLVRLKREITLYRVVHEALGAEAPVVCLHDWNLQEPPFFTESEWVEGGDFGQWLAAESPPLAERLEAMAQLCEAVSATHSVGVVHKDLKPGNVLIRRRADARLQVLLADFGIGALSDAGAIAALGITRLGFTGTRIGSGDSSGTPAYLAPEVIGGAAPTQRSDLYALGVMLYQMAVGDLRRPLAPGWERDIEDSLLREDIAAAADVEPERRLADAGALAQRLRQLEQRRSQRDSALAAETKARTLHARLQRSRLQRRWLLGLSAIFLLGAVSSLWLYRQASEARAVAEAINTFLNEDLLAQASPYLAPHPDMRLREVLDRASGEVEERLADTPAAEAGVRWALARAYRALGEPAEAERHLQRAGQLWGVDEGASNTRALAFRELAARIAFDLGRTEEGDQRMQALRRDHRGAAAEQVRLANVHGQELIMARRSEEALDVLRSVAEVRESSAAVPLIEKAHALSAEAAAMSTLGRRDEARERLGRALELLGSADEDQPFLRSTLLLTLGQIERKEGRFADAELHFREGLALRLSRLQRVHPDVQTTLNELASVLQDMDREDEAEPLFREVLEQRVRQFGDQHPLTRNSLNNLGMLLSSRGQHEEAEALIRRALEIETELLGAEHPEVLILGHNLSGLLRRKGDLEGALVLNLRNAEVSQRIFGPERDEPGIYMLGLAFTLARMERREESAEAFERSHAWLLGALGPEHPRVRRVLEMREEVLGR